MGIISSRLELESENNRLQKENEQLEALCDTYRTCYQAKHSDIKCLFPKYKQTLQEIRKYAVDLIDGVKGGCEPDIGTILLKKINEVMGDNYGYRDRD